MISRGFFGIVINSRWEMRSARPGRKSLDNLLDVIQFFLPVVFICGLSRIPAGD